MVEPPEHVLWFQQIHVVEQKVDQSLNPLLSVRRFSNGSHAEGLLAQAFLVLGGNGPRDRGPIAMASSDRPGPAAKHLVPEDQPGAVADEVAALAARADGAGGSAS